VKHEEGEIKDAELMARIDFLSGCDEIYENEIGVIASHFYELSISDFDRLGTSALGVILSDSRLVIRDEDWLFEIVHRRASADLSFFGLLEFVRFEFVSDDCMQRALELISSAFDSLTFGVWSSLQTRLGLSVTPPSQPNRFCLPTIDSTIISTTPNIFSCFGDARFRLLWRGSRDGFGANDFHDRCDGHAKTVTLIKSKNHCIFGGYTPVAWIQSCRGDYVADSSLTSFLFTIRNPHRLDERIFKLKQAACAIYGHQTWGPTFGNWALRICDQCQNSSTNHSGLDNGYINDTGISGSQVLTGQPNFSVEEIEVFQVM
jgi:hypothetical protein